MKILYIITGLPGSGKSTLGHTLANNHCHSADDYMVDACGNYEYDPKKLSFCHSSCQTAVEIDMNLGHDVIVVANTGAQKWEIEPYFKLARKYDYSPFVIRCENNFGSVHIDPEKNQIVRARMKSRWEDKC